ncbi:MAG TPA: sodium:proline symporter [Flavobacteriales bacterium]|nr:sodium:proline symporter [Flavobacteriales bacterium]
MAQFYRKVVTIDWIIVILYLSLTIYIGFRYKSQAGKSLSDFFLGGRNIPWYIAGISMVATTFAADTPLWVTERVAMFGVSGNWIWWNMLIGGMLTTFFFAQYWRRAEVLTELEFIELRYSGKAAELLRGFKSVYMGLVLNAIIIGWVNAAMIMILGVFFGLQGFEALVAVSALMFLVALYSTLSGLKGVVITDTVQFLIAMASCIILAWIALSTDKVGGIARTETFGGQWRFDFFPVISSENPIASAGEVFSVTIGSFLTYGLIQWWASWYPGAEPGGGGYVAQRIMGTKNEKHAIYATLFFQIAHYCLRPWPWIIVGLCSLVLYPDLPIDQAGQGFVMTMRDYLPVGLKGLLFVAFLAAYMSTISTQLNWGASYLTNDLYKRFIKKEDQFSDTEKADRHYVAAGRVLTVVIMLVAVISTSLIETIDQAARFLIECGAGLGLVLILRWYWWRINAWSEIAAVIAPFAGYIFSNYVLHLEFPSSFLLTTGITTVTWLLVTFLSPAEPIVVLEKFYFKIKPSGNWKIIDSTDKDPGDLKFRFVCWFAAMVMTYSSLFLIGYTIFQNWSLAILNFCISLSALFLLKWGLSKLHFFNSKPL